MTARQPQSVNEAIMLGQGQPPMMGLFGGGRRRRPGLLGGGAVASPYAAPQVDAAPPITDAPAPPTDWQSQLGPELLGNLPQADPAALQAQPLSPSPPMRSGFFGGGRVPLGSPGSPPGPAALAAAAGGAMQRGNGNFADTAADAMPKKHGIDWRMIAGIVGDSLAGLNGQPPLYAQAMYKERQARADQQRQIAEITLRSRLDAAKPEYFTAGNDRVRYDPTSGATQTLYTAPEAFDTYARALGAEPGTAEYDRLAQDYVLKTGGPTATGLNMDEEDHRQDNRLAYEDHRQTNRETLQGQRFQNSRTLRALPTYRQSHSAPRSPGRSGGRSGGVREGQTATGPGGAKMVYRGGKWEPLK